MMFDAFHDEEGMTTVGVVLSLLVTLALVFSAGQAYRVGSASSEVQNVADAAALAAQNEVGEFMIVVRVCDAAVLSLSLTSLVATGLGVAALCTPATASASETLLKAGRDVAYARDRFAEKAADGLDRLQRLLPFLAAANAASVASANNGASSSYVALALLVPASGKKIAVDGAAELEDVAEAVGDEADEVRQVEDYLRAQGVKRLALVVASSIGADLAMAFLTQMSLPVDHVYFDGGQFAQIGRGTRRVMMPFLYLAIKSLYWSKGKTLKKILWCGDDAIKPYFIAAGRALTLGNLRRQLADSLEDRPFPPLPETLQRRTYFAFGSAEDHEVRAIYELQN